MEAGIPFYSSVMWLITTCNDARMWTLVPVSCGGEQLRLRSFREEQADYERYERSEGNKSRLKSTVRLHPSTVAPDRFMASLHMS